LIGLEQNFLAQKGAQQKLAAGLLDEAKDAR